MESLSFTSPDPAAVEVASFPRFQSEALEMRSSGQFHCKAGRSASAVLTTAPKKWDDQGVSREAF